jgi:hypothetical protein
MLKFVVKLSQLVSCREVLDRVVRVFKYNITAAKVCVNPFMCCIDGVQLK